MLSLVGAGKGTYPVPDHMRHYYARPDVAYLPITDAAPLEWVFTWRRATDSRRIRAFNQAASDLVARSGGADARTGFV
jgi:hypothetical protein